MSEKANIPMTAVDFNKQMGAERGFYLGQTEVIPGTDMTLEEAKKRQKKIEADFEQKRVERAERVRDDTLKNQAAFRKENGIENSYTSIVVPGVNVEIKNTVPVPLEVALSQNTDDLFPLPSGEELAAMEKKDLITLAGNRKVEGVRPDVDTVPALIARLQGKYSDARFESLHGKARSVLDEYAVELGLGTDEVDLKEKFANAELLSDAIEKARKKAV